MERESRDSNLWQRLRQTGNSGAAMSDDDEFIRHSNKSVEQIAADIVIAYLSSGTVAAPDLPDLVRRVRIALTDDQPAASPPLAVQGAAPGDVASLQGSPDLPRATNGVLSPAVPVDQSVFPGYLVCLEDGGHYRSLKRHLRVKYGMTPEDYRKKWGLAETYPMVAPEYAKDRSEVAKRIGLGKRKPASSSAGQVRAAPPFVKSRRPRA